MSWRTWRCIAVAGVSLLAAACSEETRTVPLTPADPATSGILILSAPVPLSPIEGAVTNTHTPTLSFQAAASNDPASAVTYELQVLTQAGDVVYTRNLPGGPANGQATISHTVEADLGRWRTYNWRARAVSGSTTGPWSDSTSAAGSFVTTRPNASTSNDEFRDYFFDLVQVKNVGPSASQGGLAAMDPELNAAGVILAKEFSGFLRGRLYLPTGNPNDKYARSVDVVTGFGPGFAWTWVFRGRTTCEGVCP